MSRTPNPKSAKEAKLSRSRTLNPQSSQVCEGKLIRAVQEAVETFERALSSQVGGADASQGEGYAVQTVRNLQVEARLVFEGQVIDGDLDKHRKVLEERLAEAGDRVLADFRSRAKSWASDLLSGEMIFLFEA